MRLSEAIRLGAMMKPKGTGDFLNGGRTCAIGAALDAVGRLDDHFTGYMATEGLWPWTTMCVDPPVPCLNAHRVLDVITTLNDVYGWTRERIADWVESIERQQEQQQRAPVADVVAV